MYFKYFEIHWNKPLELCKVFNYRIAVQDLLNLKNYELYFGFFFNIC